MPDPHDRRGAPALSDAGGHGRVARVGLAGAIVGQLIVAAAGVIWPSPRDLGDVLFGVSPILTGAGPVTAGVAIIRAGVRARPSRFPSLTLGLYITLVPIPVMIASGGPPTPPALWTTGGSGPRTTVVKIVFPAPQSGPILPGGLSCLSLPRRDQPIGQTAMLSEANRSGFSFMSSSFACLHARATPLACRQGHPQVECRAPSRNRRPGGLRPPRDPSTAGTDENEEG